MCQKNFEIWKNFWVGKFCKKWEIFGKILGCEKVGKLGGFLRSGIGKILRLLWVCYWGVGAGLAGLRIFVFLVFFGVFVFLVVFDIYV